MSLSNEMDNNFNVSNATTYRCDICIKPSGQKSHHDLHLQSDKHKQQKIIFKLELQQKTTEELQTEYKTTDIDAIIRQKETVKIAPKIIQEVPFKPIIDSISNKEALKDKIHDMHNYLRNNGGGYGMNALKVFNILYGLKKIQENNLIDLSNTIQNFGFTFSK